MPEAPAVDPIRRAEVSGWVIGDFSANYPFRPPLPPQHTDS